MGDKIIERYILRDFFRAFLMAIVAIVIIYLITDFFERIGFYIDRKVPGKILAGYYFFHSFYVLILIAPLAFLLGVYFSLGRLTKNNEVLAMRGLGISPFFIYRPVFLWALLLSLGFTYINANVVPWALHNKRVWWREKILKIGSGQAFFERKVSMVLKSGWYLYADRLLNRTLIGIDLIYMKDGKIRRRVYAKRGIYQDGKWVLKDVYIRSFGERERFEKKEELTAEFITESPEDILKKRQRPEEMGILRLLNHIRELSRRGQPVQREKLEFYRRFSYPALCFILVLYGCPLALEVKRKGLAFGLGWGLFLAFFFWGIVQLFSVLGEKGAVYPFLAATLPNLAFLTGGIILMWVRKM